MKVTRGYQKINNIQHCYYNAVFIKLESSPKRGVSSERGRSNCIQFFLQKLTGLLLFEHALLLGFSQKFPGVLLFKRAPLFNIIFVKMHRCTVIQACTVNRTIGVPSHIELENKWASQEIQFTIQSTDMCLMISFYLLRFQLVKLDKHNKSDVVCTADQCYH